MKGNKVELNLICVELQYPADNSDAALGNFYLNHKARHSAGATSLWNFTRSLKCKKKKCVLFHTEARVTTTDVQIVGYTQTSQQQQHYTHIITGSVPGGTTALQNSWDVFCYANCD